MSEGKMTTKARKGGRSHATSFTEASVKKLKLPDPGEQEDWFEKLKRGLTLGLRISYGGTKAWRVGYYIAGKPRAKTLGRYPALGVAAARKAAYAFDPLAAHAAAQAGSFREVAENWLKRHVAANGLRSQGEIERILKYYVYKPWGERPFFEIRRADVSALLDKLEDEHGPSQADGVLAVLRSIMNWFQTRDDNYVSPIVKGMKRDKRKASERARKRILFAARPDPSAPHIVDYDDTEIRAVWKACDEMGLYGALVRLLLLTAQRLDKVVKMRWEDISSDGVWTIATEEGEKGNAGEIKLPPLALEIIKALPQIDHNPYVFPGSIRGRRHKSADRSQPPAFNSFSQRKEELLAKLPAKMPPWTLHDLRRTARSLMARAGVADNVAERVLGHAIGGVHGIYNRHDYFAEKTEALQRLATLVETIINLPDKTNVVNLTARR
jgi:integrase